MTGLYCERAKWAYHVAPSEWAAGVEQETRMAVPTKALLTVAHWAV